MTGAQPGPHEVAGDIELDLLLLTAKTGALATLAAALDITAGLADIRAGPGHTSDEPDTG